MEPTTHQTSIKICPSGQLDIKGEISQEKLNELLDRAAFYRLQSIEVEKKKIKASTEVDKVVVISVSFFLLITTYFIYLGIQQVKPLFTPSRETNHVRIVG
jgi:hypothetical protein